MGLARGITSIAKTSLQRGQAPLETYQHRLAVCGQCPKRYVDERNRNRCGQCNCYIVPKALDNRESCPLGKW